MSIFANSEEIKIKITEIRYYGNNNQFDVDFDLENADADQHSYASNFSQFYADWANITVFWIQDPGSGEPPSASGFQRKDPEVETQPSGGAYKDKRGNKWKIAREQHGGPHWDVSLRKGGHINVMPPIPESPEWKVRGGNKALKKVPCKSKKQAKAIIGRMNGSGGDDIEIPEDENELVQIMERVGEGYLIHKDSTTVIAVTIAPTTEGGSDGGLLHITPGN